MDQSWCIVLGLYGITSQGLYNQDFDFMGVLTVTEPLKEMNEMNVIFLESQIF
jgi:hypothetical protein